MKHPLECFGECWRDSSFSISIPRRKVILQPLLVHICNVHVVKNRGKGIGQGWVSSLTPLSRVRFFVGSLTCIISLPFVCRLGGARKYFWKGHYRNIKKNLQGRGYMKKKYSNSPNHKGEFEIFGGQPRLSMHAVLFATCGAFVAQPFWLVLKIYLYIFPLSYW